MPSPSLPRRAFLASLGLITAGSRAAADWPRFRGPNGDGVVPDRLDLLPAPEKVWEAEVGQGNASLVVRDGLLYTVGLRRGRMYLRCLDAATGEGRWEKEVDSWNADSSPAVAGGKIYLLCTFEQKPIVHCLDADGGKPVWKRELSKPTGERHYGHAGSPLLWEDLVIVNAGAGAALKRDTGSLVWQHGGLSGLATPVLYREQDRDAVMI